MKDDETLRSKAIYRHVRGSDAREDVLIYEETDETFSTAVYKTKSRKYLVIGSFSTLTSEFRFLSAEDPEGEFRVVQPRERGLEYNISHFGDHFYIITNMDAKNFRLMKTNTKLNMTNTQLQRDKRNLMNANDMLKADNRELATKIDMLKILDHRVEEKRKNYTSD